ncbi:MAG TPA: NAD(P)-dependent oxidoreductase [Rhodocyclaceae bacterium]|nr:NAD(P)-dependent oxidoreductase [Rhodocyclaceae bacterium]
MRSVAFIGLGRMGLPMARLLLKAGFNVTVFNRTRAKAEPLAAEGAVIADTVAAAIEPGGIVVTMLANDAALQAIADDVMAKLGRGGLHISMSTVSPETTRDLAARHAAAGSELIAAPVFGRPEAAAAKLLRICVSGAPAALVRARPLLDAMSQSIHEFGAEVGAANVQKLVGNFMILAAVEAMAEAFALGEKNGLDRKAMNAFFSETIFACAIYQNYGRIAAERSYQPPGFAMPLGMKDIRLVRDVAEESRVPMPLADLLHARLLTALAKGREDYDWTAIELSSAEDAALR